MDGLTQKRKNAARRAGRVRIRTKGTADRPRLVVNISNRHVTSQIIDDSSGRTLAYATSVGGKDLPANLTTRAEYVGTQIAKLAKKAKVKKVVLDRGQRLYHGRVKVLAAAARDNGLEF